MKLIGGVLTAAIATSGCSALFMERLPANYDPFEQDAHCSATKGFVAWDGVLGVAHIVGAIAWGVAASGAAADTSGGVGDRTKFIGVAAVDGAFAIGHFASAVKGSEWSEECRKQRIVRETIERKRSN